MTEIKGTDSKIRVVETNSPQTKKNQKVSEADFSSELMRSIDAMERMGSAIDVASKNMESGPNSISNITTNLNDVEKWIDRIHGVVNDISAPEQQVSGSQAKQAYEKATPASKQKTNT